MKSIVHKSEVRDILTRLKNLCLPRRNLLCIEDNDGYTLTVLLMRKQVSHLCINGSWECIDKVACINYGTVTRVTFHGPTLSWNYDVLNTEMERVVCQVDFSCT